MSFILLLGFLFVILTRCFEDRTIVLKDLTNSVEYSIKLDEKSDFWKQISKYLNNSKSEYIIEGNHNTIEINNVSIPFQNRYSRITLRHLNLTISLVKQQVSLSGYVTFDDCYITIENCSKSFLTKNNIHLNFTNSVIKVNKLSCNLLDTNCNLILYDTTITSSKINHIILSNINLSISNVQIVNSSMNSILDSNVGICNIQNLTLNRVKLFSPLFKLENCHFEAQNISLNKVLYYSKACLIDSKNMKKLKIISSNFSNTFGNDINSSVIRVVSTKSVVLQNNYIGKQNNIWSLFEDSEFSIEKSNFSVSHCIVSSVSSKGTIEICNFENCSKLSVIDSTNSTISLDRCEFVRCKAKKGSVLVAKSNSSISMIDVNSFFCEATEKGAVAYIEDSKLRTDMCTFKYNKAPAAPSLFLKNSNNSEIKRTESKFNNGRFTFIYATGNMNLSINSVRIDDYYTKSVYCSENVNVQYENAYFKCAGRCQPVWEHFTPKPKNISVIEKTEIIKPLINYQTYRDIPIYYIILLLLVICFLFEILYNTSWFRRRFWFRKNIKKLNFHDA